MSKGRVLILLRTNIVLKSFQQFTRKYMLKACPVQVSTIQNRIANNNELSPRCILVFVIEKKHVGLSKI